MTETGQTYMQILGAAKICSLMPLAPIKARVQFVEIMRQSPTSSRSWHIAHWPLLAWLETVIKLAALTIGIIAGINALTVGGYMLLVLLEWMK